MTPVLASTQIRQHRPAEIGQAENLVQLAIGQEPSIGGDPATMEFQLQAAVEIDPQRWEFGFTHRIRHGLTAKTIIRY